MNLKDFNSVEKLVPIQYINREGIETKAVASISVVRGGDTVITIPGGKHSVAFMEMILLQVLTGFTVNQQVPQSGIPGHDVEVTMGPSDEMSVAELCGNHKPVQHRDGMEPWCPFCSMNKDHNEPRRIQFSNRPLQFKESLRVYEETDTVEGP